MSGSSKTHECVVERHVDGISIEVDVVVLLGVFFVSECCPQRQYKWWNVVACRTKKEAVVCSQDFRGFYGGGRKLGGLSRLSIPGDIGS